MSEYGPKGTRESIFDKGQYITKEECRRRLPKVGQVLKKMPNFYECYKKPIVRPAVVIAVYPEKLCYLIEFSTPKGNYKEFRRWDD